MIRFPDLSGKPSSLWSRVYFLSTSFSQLLVFSSFAVKQPSPPFSGVHVPGCASARDGFIFSWSLLSSEVLLHVTSHPPSGHTNFFMAASGQHSERAKAALPPPPPLKPSLGNRIYQFHCTIFVKANHRARLDFEGGEIDPICA